mgnify:CR=1 FL=1
MREEEQEEQEERERINPGDLVMIVCEEREYKNELALVIETFFYQDRFPDDDPPEETHQEFVLLLRTGDELIFMRDEIEKA